MIKRIGLCALVLVACILSIQAQTQVIAHRGFWKTEGSAQNSITALEKAADAKLYGSEFDVLMTADGKIVVNHAKPLPTKEMEDQAIATIVKMVKKMGLEKQVEYISFSLNMCEQLAKLTPESEIAYLEGNIAPAELKKKGINGIDYHVNVILNKHPEWVKEAHDLGMKVNVWTVNNESDMKKLIDMKVDYITTDQPLELQKLLP